MVISKEILHHFSCKSCGGWWSIASENDLKPRQWYCPWCGVTDLYNERNIPVGGEVSAQEDN